MTMPHVELGNTASDIGSGVNSFAAGLMAQRQRMQQIALQEALGQANVAHINAQTNTGIPAQAAADTARAGYTAAETTKIPSEIAHNTAEASKDMPVDDVSWARFTQDKPNLRNTPPQLRASISHAWASGVYGYHPSQYQSVGISPEGKAIVLNSHSGQLTTTDTRMQPKGSNLASNQKIRMGATNAANALRSAEKLLEQDPDADVKPVMTAMANGAEHIPVIGSALSGLMEPAGMGAMSPHQQQFDAAMSQFSHNAVGLLPGSRQSLTLFNDLRNAYRPKAGESPEARAFKQGQRHRLIAKFEALARGEQVDLSEDLGPDFSSLNAEGAPTTSTPSGASTAPTTSPYGYTKH